MNLRGLPISIATASFAAAWALGCSSANTTDDTGALDIVDTDPGGNADVPGDTLLELPWDLPADTVADASPDGAGDVPTTLNGCEPAAAEDLTGQATVTVLFGGTTGFAYSPKCFRVAVGMQVTFEGSFALHPLNGGTVQGITTTPDGSSPFMPETSTGNSKTFTLSDTGTFGFYCGVHHASGMAGVIWVE